jgi:PKD repeat protein
MKNLLALMFVWALALPAFSQDVRPVRFDWGSEIFPQNIADVRARHTVEVGECVNGRYVRYIQCERVLSTAERQILADADLHILGYVHFGAYLISLPQNFDFQHFDPTLVRSVVPVKPDWKLANTLREQPFGDWAVQGDQIAINLQLYPHVRPEQGAAWCQQQGMTLLKVGTQGGLLQLRVPQSDLAQIAALPFVQYLEQIPPPGQKEDTRGRSLHRANMVDSDSPMGKKYTGEGVGVLVRDDGQLGPHIDLQGRLTNLALGSPNAGTHGDGVAGIVGGAGNLDPTKKGMAAGADIYSLDYVNDFQDETLPLHLEQGVTITNSSYSDGCNAGYTSATRTVDQQIFQYPTLMHVFSAGNSNGNDCDYGAGSQWGNITGGHKMAKNAIATANLLPNATLDETSSRGPAHDGRLKPDIAANGTDHNSLDPDNGYQVFGGTSGAAPGIAGCLAQLTHAYKTLHSGQEPTSALLKASILNTANDLGNAGPDFQFGWGHINAWRALRLLEQNNWLEGDADQNADLTHAIQIPAGAKQVKIMLLWAEPPASLNAARALLNDLDLSVTASNGATTLPWKLNPTPNPALLNAPATRGRDSLNNVEQVLLENPAAGTYNVKIAGYEVPFGPQHYYLVWDFVFDEIKITYPSGGEGLVPGESERIHWDAFGNTGSFALRYSTDNGATSSPIATASGSSRMFNWTVPNTVSGHVRLIVSRDAVSDTTDFPSSIVRVPQGLVIQRVCPDSMTIGWNELNDTLSYDVYLLGSKYMEIQGTSNTNSYTFPIDDAGASQWVSVRASHPDGTAGRRALAINWPGELKNCPQAYDLGVRQFLSPGGDAIVSCSGTEQALTVKIVNEGQNTLSGGSLSYQVGNATPVTEALPTLAVGSELAFTFATPISLTTNGLIGLKVWGTQPDDSVDFNDTLEASFPVIAQSASGFFNENFQNTSTPLPAGWAVVNPDDRITWEAQGGITGASGQTTRAIYLNCYDYGPDDIGAEDILYMIPANLEGVTNPGLRFDLAHTRYSTNFEESLRVELFDNCDLASAPIIIWQKTDPALATAPTQTDPFFPENASEWRTEYADLSPYIGHDVIMRFVSTNGFGNNIFLDNIGIETFVPPVPPVAAIVAANDTVCKNAEIDFEALPATGIGATYAWNFGALAQPSSAAGLGPHTVVYPTAGNKTVRLIVTNGQGADTATFVVTVLQFPGANFTQSLAGLSATFNNTSTNATSYLWDFGDGNSSTAASPTHTYAAPGTYAVKLTATNQCTTNTKTVNLTLTSSVNELAENLGIRILPNPTEGDFQVQFDSRIAFGTARLSLLDAQGRLVKTIETELRPGIATVPFQGLALPKGLYQLNIQTDAGLATLSVAVQ